MSTAEQIEWAVNAVDFGRPEAQKRGRNPEFPYVPVVRYGRDQYDPEWRQEQILARAYATKDEALSEARRIIDARRDALASALAKREQRALREHHGLPRELADA